METMRGFVFAGGGGGGGLLILEFEEGRCCLFVFCPGDPLMISALNINYFADVPRRVALREGSRQQDWVENPPLSIGARPK